MNKSPEPVAIRKTSFPKVHHRSHHKSTVIHVKCALSTGKNGCADRRIGECADERNFQEPWKIFEKKECSSLYIYIYGVDCFFSFCMRIHLSNPATNICLSEHPHICVSVYSPISAPLTIRIATYYRFLHQIRRKQRRIAVFHILCIIPFALFSPSLK